LIVESQLQELEIGTFLEFLPNQRKGPTQIKGLLEEEVITTTISKGLINHDP